MRSNMPNSKIVEIIVYDAPSSGSSSSEGCGCGCGGHGPSPGEDHDHDHPHKADPLSRISMEMQTQALAMTMEELFPGKVKVKYINVLKDPQAARLPQTALLCSLAYPTPMVYINGQGRFAGALPVERIRDEVAGRLNAH